MQREHAIRQLAKLEGYARFNVAVYLLDGVSLEKITEFLERRTNQVNAPDRRHR